MTGKWKFESDMQEKRLRTNADDNSSSTDTTATEERLGVSSLRHICLRFIAANVEHVDSLVGFPEVVGKALFSEVEKCGNLHLDNPQCSVTIQLFLDAYGAAILEHLILRHAHLLIDQHFDLWQRFTHLRVLDLRGCHVGDGHDILSFVGLLKCLKCLSFQDNCLSDDGVRRLTCPSRVLARGPSDLCILDLSANPLITDTSLRYLLHFKMLEILDLSGTKVSKLGVKTLEDKSALRVDAAAVSDVDKTFSGVCVGWAANTVTRWTTDSRCGHLGDCSNRSSIAKFYGQSKQRLAMAQSLISHKPPCRDPVICLIKVQKVDVKDRQSTNTTSGEQVTRRSTHRKQQELSHEDWALMTSYCT